MHPDAYKRFSQTLVDRLSSNPAVLGLVALGSMAERDYGPDRWSDHDFFMITEDGQETAFRDDPIGRRHHEARLSTSRLRCDALTKPKPVSPARPHRSGLVLL